MVPYKQLCSEAPLEIPYAHKENQTILFTPFNINGMCCSEFATEQIELCITGVKT